MRSAVYKRYLHVREAWSRIIGRHANGEGASVAWQERSVRRDEVRGWGETVPGVFLEVEEGIPYQLDGGMNGDAAVESSAESRGIGYCGKGRGVGHG